MTPDLFDELVADSRDELVAAGVDLDFMRRRARECLPGLTETASTVFARWGEFL
jgi:hypothetical protein